MPDEPETMECQPAIPADVSQKAAPAGAQGQHAMRRQVRSSDLFGGCREVLIEHSGEMYSLRRTSKGKLILTK